MCCQETGSSEVSYLQLDLASLASIHCFCEHFLSSGSRLDLLINNAGTTHASDWLTCGATARLCVLQPLSCRSGG